MSTRKQQERKHRQRQHHTMAQAELLREALTAVESRARRQKKGPKFVIEQMEKLGYTKDGERWRRIEATV